MSFDYKKIIPHLVAIGVFTLIVFTYFKPYFEGYVLHQGDVKHWKGMAKEVQDHRYSENEDPKWTNSMFGGMPAYQITNEDNSNKLKWIQKFSSLNLKQGFGNMLVAFIGFYILLVLLGVSPWLSIVGGVAFGLSTYNIIILSAGHNTKLGAIGWMPAVFGAVLFIYNSEDKKQFLGLFLLALFMGLELNSNHVQITYYLGGIVGIVVLAKFIESIIKSQLSSFLKKTGIIVVGMLIGVMCNFGLLYNTYKYSKQTIRGKSELIAQKDKEKQAEAKRSKGRDGLDFDYITNWSLGVEETASVLIANIKGGASNEFLRSLEGVKETKDIRNLKRKVSQYYQQNTSQVNNGGYIKSYWGNQPFTSGPIYMGITVFLLFILGLVLEKGYLRWIAIAGTLVFVLLAWGKNFEEFNRWVIANLPMYNKFRAVSMTMVIVQLLLPLIGFWGLHLLIKKRDDLKIKTVIVPVAVVLVLLTMFFVSPESWFTFVSIAEEEKMGTVLPNSEFLNVINLVQDYRVDFFKGEVKRALLYVILTGAVVIGFIKVKFDSKILITAIGFLVLTDLWTANLEYQNNDKEKGSKRYKMWIKEKKNSISYKAEKADIAIATNEFRLNPSFRDKYVDAEKILKKYKRSEGKKTSLKSHEKEELRFKVIRDNSHYRVFKLDNPFNDASVSYFHKSVGGYHAAKLMRYQELIENAIYREMSAIQSSFGSRDIDVIENSMINTPVLNMLNTKYVVYNRDAPPLVNKHANGFAWSVKEIIFVDSPNEEIEKVGGINTKSQALVDKRFQEQLASVSNFGNDTAIVQLLGVKSNELNYNFQSQGDQVLIFSDIYYADGWNAYIDDKPVNHFRANYVLRGLFVPSGNHKISFKFEPKSVAIGMVVNTIFSLFVILGLAFFAYKQIKSNASEEIVDTE